MAWKHGILGMQQHIYRTEQQKRFEATPIAPMPITKCMLITLPPSKSAKHDSKLKSNATIGWSDHK